MSDRAKMTEGQRAYEEKRAAKAGMSFEKWMAAKERAAAEAARANEREMKKAAKSTKPPGLLSRLLDRAHKPL